MRGHNVVQVGVDTFSSVHKRPNGGYVSLSGSQTPVESNPTSVPSSFLTTSNVTFTNSNQKTAVQSASLPVL